MDIYKSVGFSTTDRGPVGSSLADRLPADVYATVLVCMLLFRGPVVHHVTSLEGQKYIFKVQRPM
jgi:hypothetical protein